jgi:ribosomal protein S17
MEVENMSKAMAEIHAQVAEEAMRDLKVSIQYRNDKMHVRSPNFQVGDYVLVAEHRESSTSKFQVKWNGPRRVASVESDYVFVVKNLLTKELKAAHAIRLKFYNEKGTQHHCGSDPGGRAQRPRAAYCAEDTRRALQ